MRSQPFISEASIKELYEGIFRWFPRHRKGQCIFVSLGPEIRYPSSELTAILTGDPAGNASLMNFLCCRLDDMFTFHLWANSGNHAAPRESVDHF